MPLTPKQKQDIERKKKKTIPDKIGKKYIQVFDPIFGRRINVLLNYTAEDYSKWLNNNGIKDIEEKGFDDFAGFCTDITSKNDQTEILIIVMKFNWAIKCQGTLIHEITHAVVRIFNLNNIPFTTETQEFFAHMIGRIYEDIAHKLVV